MSGRIVYSCPFVPAEWIAAHGFRPSRITPSAAEMDRTIAAGAGVCPFARAFAGAVIADRDIDGVVITTVCDQMRRISEIVAARIDAPVFLMNVPSTCETPQAHRLYLSELERLGRFLIRLGGSASDLAATVARYDLARAELRGSRGVLSPRAYSESIALFHRDPEGWIASDRKPAPSPPHPGRIPLALVGGPLLAEHFRFFDAIERAGGDVVLDATETGDRTLPAPIDRRRCAKDPLGALADAYFGSIPDVARRPNSGLYRWLRREIDERGVRGVMFVRYLWCDLWHAESQRMKDWLGLPFFDLDITEGTGDESRRRTRFEAFMEMLL